MVTSWRFLKKGLVVGAALSILCAWSVPPALAQPCNAIPGGSLDPCSITKYVTPLVIPPVMDDAGTAAGSVATPNVYDIAVRQFKQQILPLSDGFAPTTVWSYGPTADLEPTGGIAPAANSQFNYPAYTIETMSNVPVNVRWRNELKPNFGADTGWLEHLLPVDQTLHWANPKNETLCRNGNAGTDCATNEAGPYFGPVPIVTHVHGAHVDPHSDGYPEAWWLPADLGSSSSDYAKSGSLFDDAFGGPGNRGWADYVYRQDQPATTLWYHDHSLGMTRLNVYAGPAGFWLIRGGKFDKVTDGVSGKKGRLPGPPPNAGQTVLELNTPGHPIRSKTREIPIVIQDRSFDNNGANLFYPNNRAFFEGLNAPSVAPSQFPDEGNLEIPFVPAPTIGGPNSDIAPTWNPEAFFNVMVVNGVSWPTLDVAQAQYRFRLLNGCNSRFLNLSLCVVNQATGECSAVEIPFYQIGAEQGFLRQVVKIQTGFATPLPGNGSTPTPVAAPDPDQALVMGLAERADVIVDFSGLLNGTVVRMINTGPDEPFGGFTGAQVAGDEPAADPDTTGQVMQFVVTNALNGKGQTDPFRKNGSPNKNAATSPENLVLNAEPALALPTAPARQVSLNEGESETVFVPVFAPGTANEGEFVLTDPGGDLIEVAADDGPASNIFGLPSVTDVEGDPDLDWEAAPFGPKEALLGTVTGSGATATGNPLKWTDTTGASTGVRIMLENGDEPIIYVTENPAVGAIEDWEIYNFTVDAHPIHLHLVRFEVVSRTVFDNDTSPGATPVVQPWEVGFKDTVIAYPGQITTVRAKFDVEGLYVWHCHIVEHEDNEMMRPYVVGGTPIP